MNVNVDREKKASTLACASGQLPVASCRWGCRVKEIEALSDSELGRVNSKSRAWGLRCATVFMFMFMLMRQEFRIQKHESKLGL